MRRKRASSRWRLDPPGRKIYGSRRQLLNARSLVGTKWTSKPSAGCLLLGVNRPCGLSETGSIGLRAWHVVRVLSGPPRSPPNL